MNTMVFVMSEGSPGRVCHKRRSLSSRIHQKLIQPNAAWARIAGHVHCVEEAHLAGCECHHDRVGAEAVTEEANAIEQRPGCDAAGGEDDLLAGREIFRSID